MSQINFFKVNNFSIIFKDQRSLELMVQNANLPGFTLGDLTIPRPVVADKRPGDSLDFSDLSVTVICDEELKAFKEVYNYLILAANPTNGHLEINETVFDCQLNLLTNKNNYNHKLYFYNAFIKSVGDISLQSDTTEGEAPTFEVSFGYSYYEFI